MLGSGGRPTLWSSGHAGQPPKRGRGTDTGFGQSRRFHRLPTPGLPPSVLQACYRVVSISSERTASYNVAVAGSIVLHDRLAKRKLAVRAAEQSRQTAQVRSEQEQKQKQKQKQKQTPDPPVTPTMQPQTPAS